MAQTTVVIGCSAELKAALNAWAFEHDMSANEVSRQALSAFIGYDLESEKAAKTERRGRPRKYNDDKARKAAAAERARVQRKTARELVAQYRRQQAREDMAKFRQSVENRYGAD